MAFTLSTIYKAIDRYSPIVRKMELATAGFALRTEYNLGKTSSAFAGLQKTTGNFISKLLSLRNAAIIATGGIIIKRLWDESQAIAKIGDEAANTGRMLGISAEALQELQFAGRIQNVENEALINSFRFLNKNVGELRLGTGALYSNLKKSNPTLLQQLKHVKNNEQAFNLITTAINKLPTQFDKTALAQAAFGRSGAQMLKLTDAGTEGIAKLRDEAKKYGGVISNEVANKMDEYMDTQDRMKMAMQGLKVQIMTGLMPTIQSIAQRLTAWIGNNRELLKSKISEWAARISNAFKWLANNIGTIIKLVKWALIVFAGIWGVNAALKALVLTTNILKGAFMAFNFVQGAFFAFQKAVPIAIGASKSALLGYNIAMKATSVWLGIVKVATWLFSAALWACPITWIVAGILAIIAGIVLLVIYWDKVKAKMDEWSKSALFQILSLVFPILKLVELIGFIQDRWKGIKKAFSGGGFLEGIKAIGKTLLSFILKPIEVILKAIGKIPGMTWAANASLNIAEFRDNLDKDLVETKTEVKPVNTIAAANDMQTQRYEEVKKNQLQIELNNKTDKQANIKYNPAKIPVLGTTFGQ
jgi:hypothetical protein